MRRSVMLLVSVASAVLLACGAAWAAAGDLDPTFGGGDGQVVGGTATCPADDLAVLPEGGKILSFGEYCGRLHRYDPDGSPDETFGGDGTVTYGYEGTDYPINITPLAFLAQPDGGIVVGGYADAENGDPQFTLARFLSDGTLDEGFGGGDGTVAVGFGERTSEEVTALAMQGDNIVAAGDTSVGVALARFLPDGTPDATFGGGDGKLTANLGTYGRAKDLAVLPDGRLMVAGYAGYVNDFMLARFRPDGAIDKSFGGGDGRLRTGFARGTNDFGWSLVVKGSRAIVAGATYADTKDAPGRFALVAYAEDGSLLKSFGGGDGKVKTVFGVGDAFARDAVVQEDGKLLVVGQRNKFLKGWRGIDFALARYEPDGTLDASFGGGDGKLVTDVSPGMDDSAEAVAVDAEGRAVVGGQAIVYNSSSDRYQTATGLARYLLE
ncbi:MAG: hypothetical protein AVDCRST_MAG12-3190 [uncultured Rubrobacteraceae bacterium]|uniref:RTX toxins and related Ca2+-binding proteins n=1 Tax=uncultured Rubrobacteraceae bacterium TaxID=349277 RepID=A0A6J4T090_9ACTN|nr:MAG: hypothetical protein AVDCRST_MAG12-3190 [uncultured Rubrobacteraceae bacterium]